MINQESYSKEWIQRKRIEFNNSDPILIEKVIYALTLLDALCTSELKYIFKGGSSLLLLLDVPLRFSIDIDIIIEGNPYEPGDNFDYIINGTNFTKWKEDYRGESNIPKKHYKFIYNSNISNHGNQYILLDILFTENLYPSLITRKVNSTFISIEGKTNRVILPDVNSIIGDKLTAFAPHTIGIPHGSGKELEIMKQLFDIGRLFDEVDDFNVVKQSFYNVSKAEIGFRDSKLAHNEVLADTFYSALILSLRGKKDKSLYEEFELGLRKFKSYVIRSFIIDDSIETSAKVAYLTQLIKNDGNSIEKFNKNTDLSDILIEEHEYNQLNKVKKISP